MTTYQIRNLEYSSFSIFVDDLPEASSWIISYQSPSRFDTTAIQFNSQDANLAKELRIIDLHTGNVIAGRTLAANEFLIESNSKYPIYHIAQSSSLSFTSGSTLSIATYSSALNITNGNLQTKSLPDQVFIIPTLPLSSDGFGAEASLNVTKYVAASDDLIDAYFVGRIFYENGAVSETDVIFYGANGETLKSIALPDGVENVWNPILIDNELWIDTNNGYYAYENSGNTWNEIERDVFWDNWDIAILNETVVRDGQYALDLLTLVGEGELFDADADDGFVEQLPGGGLLIRGQVESDNFPISYERWLVFKDGLVIGDQSFDQATDLTIRRVVDPDQEYIYFQNINAEISLVPEFVITQDPDPALTLYKMTLNDLANYLINPGQVSIVDAQGVMVVQSFNQAELTNNEQLDASAIVLLQTYIPSNLFVDGDNGSIVFSSNLPSDGPEQFFVSKFDVNGNLIRSTALPAVEVDGNDLIFDFNYGVFFKSEDDDGNDTFKTFYLNVCSGQVSEIPAEIFSRIQGGEEVNETFWQEILPFILVVNSPPAGTDKTVSINEDGSYTFSSSDFGFKDLNDSPANSLFAVKITTLPSAGTLKLNNVDVSTGQVITAADIVSLAYTPVANANGNGYASFTFQVQDNGGTANGGFDLDPTANTITIDVAAVEDEATGSLAVTGTAEEGGSLVASLTNVIDADGLTSTAYQWQENRGTTQTPVWVDIATQTNATLSIPSDQSYVGKGVRVVATTRDVLSGTTTFTSDTQTVANVNDLPTGTVTISGFVTQGEMLTASNTLADADGLGNIITYTWFASGSGTTQLGTGANFTLTQAEVGKTITVTASYTDGFNTLESKTSAATSEVITAPFNLIGTANADTLIGGSLAETLTGLGGIDILDGKDGSDLYIMTTATDHPAAEIYDTGTTGTDEVRFTSTTANETLTLYAGDRGIEKVTIGTGNAAEAVTTGTTALNVNAAAVTNALHILGNNGNNTLTGTAFNDTLDGGLGVDRLIGGAGDDTYIVDLNANGTLQDTITEIALTTNNDKIQLRGASTNTTAATLTLAVNLEHLDASATGSSLLNLTGNTANNQLTGNAANNILNGLAGADTMAGGVGNDTYVVDNLNDIVTEQLNEGTDLVQVAIATAGGTYALTDNVENGTLTNRVAFNLTGNDLNNTLTGNAAANILNGGDGDDILNGLAGADRMLGGRGNDTYTVDNVGDVVVEVADEGTDTILSSVTYTLNTANAIGVENLTLSGTAAINATGNDLNNTLTGNAGINILNGGAGNDILIGGLGNDTLTGGLGADTFVFNTALNATRNRDTITDFLSGTDQIHLDNAIMTALGLTTGQLSADQFFSSSTAVRGNDSTDRIVYNTTSGALYYDADGSGSGAAVQIALMGVNTLLTHQDIFIV